MDSSYLIQMHSVASSALFHWTLAVEHCLMPAVLVNQFAAFPFAKCSYMHCSYIYKKCPSPINLYMSLHLL